MLTGSFYYCCVYAGYTIITEMRENKLDILGISEHRWAGYGHFSTSCGGQIIYSGRERSGQSGVAVFLSKTTVKSLIGYEPVNDKIITVRLIRQAKNITLIQVCAPTSASTEEELEEFYKTLQKEIDSKKRQDILIITADFNAKVRRKRNKEENRTVGNAGFGRKKRERGNICQFCIGKPTSNQKHHVPETSKKIIYLDITRWEH